VALPKQSINAVKDGSVPTTKRNQSLDDLLAQLKHYSSGVRKGKAFSISGESSWMIMFTVDALAGLRELLSEYSELIEPSLARLVNQCVALISDEV
jgi:pre-rRNA-processing protein IPI1